MPLFLRSPLRKLCLAGIVASAMLAGCHGGDSATDPDSKIPYIQIQLSDAVRDGDANQVGWLVHNNPQLLSVKDENGDTPLHWAAAAGKRNVVDLLLDNKADRKLKDNAGNTPLQLAEKNGNTAVAEALSQDGIYAAVRSDDLDDARKLLRADPQLVSKTDDDGETPLHWAAKLGRARMAQLLIVKNAKVDAMDMGGATPLLYAAQEGFPDVAELLMEHGANVNARPSYGLTPLLAATAHGHKEVVELLLAHRADVGAKDNRGQTALRWAKLVGDQGIEDILQQYGAR